MRKLLYLNNLENLPNFGCRSTGNSLKNKLNLFFHVVEYDGLHSVLNSPGWDKFALKPIKFGGILPYIFWHSLWKIRYKNEFLYHTVRKVDALFGGKHDFIVNNNPEQSLLNFYNIKGEYDELSELYEKILNVDLVCINGEGTFLISNNINRDASYYFFIILLCNKLKKKIYLVNCMVDEYAFDEVNDESIKFFMKYLMMLDGILVRDKKSKYFLEKSGFKKIEFCLDALFDWKDLFDNNKLKEIDRSPIEGKYILISGTSASKFYQKHIVDSYNSLIIELKKIGIPIVVMESCIGDGFLRFVADINQLIYVEINNEITNLYKYISNSYLFISGRYHPTVVAMSCGIPCISLECNSHKMTTLQELIYNKKSRIFSASPTHDEINEILLLINDIFGNYDEISCGILKSIEYRKSQSNSIVDFISN